MGKLYRAARPSTCPMRAVPGRAAKWTRWAAAQLQESAGELAARGSRGHRMGRSGFRSSEHNLRVRAVWTAERRDSRVRGPTRTTLPPRQPMWRAGSRLEPDRTRRRSYARGAAAFRQGRHYGALPWDFTPDGLRMTCCRWRPAMRSRGEERSRPIRYRSGRARRAHVRDAAARRHRGPEP